MSSQRRNLLTLIARDCQGQSLVETALSLTTLLSVIFVVIACSEAAYAKHFVVSAARGATRYAIVRGATFAGSPCSGKVFSCQATALDISNFVMASTPPGLYAGSTKVATLWPGLAAPGLNCLTLNGTNSPGCEVQVTVSYSFNVHLPFVAPRAVSFQSTSTMVIME